jgi:uncharacterized protein (TIGR02246 family)
MKNANQICRWFVMLTVIALSIVGFKSERVLQAQQSTTPTAAEGEPGLPLDQSKEAPIRALLTQMIDAWNRGDPARIAAAFTSHGHLIAGDATHVITPAEIERYFTQLLTKLPKGTTFTSTSINVQFPTPDVGILMSEGGFLFPNEKTVAPERQGILSIVAIRDGAAWHAVLVQRTRRVLPK